MGNQEPSVTDTLKLYSYWRSSAAYRVRIGLNLKGLAYETVPVHLLRDGGEQHGAAFRQTNPQGLVPVLQHGQRTLRQSVAILEYLDETWPDQPLLPALARDRQRVRAIAQVVACDIHPLNNLRVGKALRETFGADQAAVDAWAARWIAPGFEALEALVARHGAGWCHGDTPTLADCYLVPQIYSAGRFNVSMDAFPKLRAIDDAAKSHPAFIAAHPDNQPDAD